MRTLEEAWAWYSRTHGLVGLMKRLAERHWPIMPEALWKDDQFKNLEHDAVANDASAVLDEIDDLAVFVLFSVFEAIVREHVKNTVAAEASLISHPALKDAARRMYERLEEGSFYHVLDIWKPIQGTQVEEIHQVRRYRNWVAHGRKPGKKPESVTPRVAFDRLGQFLARFVTEIPLDS